jgi:hypothetical protein
MKVYEFDCRKPSKTILLDHAANQFKRKKERNTHSHEITIHMELV